MSIAPPHGEDTLSYVPQEGEPGNYLSLEEDIPHIDDDDAIAAVIAALERRVRERGYAEHAPLRPPLLHPLLVRQRLRQLRHALRGKIGWLATATTAVLIGTAAALLQRSGDTASKDVGTPSAASPPSPDVPLETSLQASMDALEENGMLQSLTLQKGENTVTIQGDECIAMAGEDDHPCAWVIRLTKEEAALLHLPPEPTVLTLFSLQNENVRRSVLAFPFGKEHHTFLVGEGSTLLPCADGEGNTEDALLLRAVLRDIPPLTQGSATPTKEKRWNDANGDGKDDRFYAWGAERGVLRMNELVQKMCSSLTSPPLSRVRNQ